jgi:2-polyprenyl-3-methyl-5-hydroxy-6-metoxy-1,4-benzoquinol methylase
MKPLSFSSRSASPRDNHSKIAKSFGTPDWYVREFAANIQIRAETVMALMQGVTFGRILDIGCGDGSLSIPLISQTKHITYLDQSAAMLNLVASRIGKSESLEIIYINQDFMEAELPTTSYDLVICVGILAYVQDIGPFLKKIRSVMRPGGALILECTDAYHFVSRIIRFYRSVTGMLKPKRFTTYRHRASEVVGVTEDLGLHLNRSFCYLYNLPILEKLVPNDLAYKWIRWVFGDIMDNRSTWLGKEHIFYFTSDSFKKTHSENR